MITQKYLREILSYNKQTGSFRWRKTRKGVKRKTAGCIATNTKTPHNQYILIGIDGKVYAAHRLAFLSVTGKTPRLVDHINHNGLDNRWINLRAATHADNLRNMRPRRNSDTPLGVRWRPERNRWRARLGTKNLGHFKTMPEAVTARNKAVKESKLFHNNHGK